MTSGNIWLDWFSVPQMVGEDAKTEGIRERQLEAIASIPTYVRLSAYFVVLCPSLPTSQGTCDFQSWKARGWCRAEQMCPRPKVSDKRLECSGYQGSGRQFD